jgi:hypothetical protein
MYEYYYRLQINWVFLTDKTFYTSSKHTHALGVEACNKVLWTHGPDIILQKNVCSKQRRFEKREGEGGRVEEI